MLALFDLGNEVNAIYLIFARKLGLVMQTTNVGIQKIDDTTFETYEIVIVVLSITDQVNNIKFFKQIFLMANVSPNMIRGMSFLTMNDANFEFLKRKL